MANNLYRDFTLTLDNCGEEPIHRPVAVQGSGHVLAVDTTHGHLVAATAQAATLFGLSMEDAWAKPATQWLPEHFIALIESGQQRSTFPLPTLRAGDTLFDVIFHVNDEIAFFELESADPLRLDPLQGLTLAQDLATPSDFDALCTKTTRMVRDVFGYDRVMIYQFDDDDHGFVVGEAKRDDLEPFLGLHYPATDIPKIARDLFLINHTRTIPDIHLENYWLEFRTDWLQSGRHLDLTYTQLRATSPVHVEYLANMGVQASMTIAIIVDDKLWGLIACHHNSPRNPPYAERAIANVLARTFSRRYLEILREQERNELAHSAKFEGIFLDNLRVDDHYQLNLFSESKDILALCDCDGAAVVSRKGAPAHAGIAPSQAVLLKLRDELLRRDEIVFTTYMAGTDFAEIGIDGTQIAGILAVRVSEISDNYLFWFRIPKRKTISWAGDPRLPGAVEREDENHNLRVSPRQSFAKWQEAVEDESLRFETSSIAMAKRLRSKILSLELQRSAKLIARSNDEFLQLTYAAAHDLREPLRTQLSYLDLLSEELAELARDDFDQYLDRSKKAVDRMQSLTNDLLEYAQLGREPAWDPVDLNQLVKNIVTDYADKIKNSNARVTCEALPTLYGDERRYSQLLQNYIGNALKYVANDVTPSIRVFAQEDGQTITVCVQDNGLGVDTADKDKIFNMFSRLHHRHDYEGTGIGLAIAKRSIETQGGKVGVDSTPDEGSRFWFRMHRNQVVRT